MSQSIRILIVDGYNREARDELVAGGAGVAGDLYAKMLTGILPDLHCDIVFPSDPGVTLPAGVALEQYHGIAWTGCSLTIYEDDERVHRQVALQRAAYEKGIPGFGTCWGLQMAVWAAGGVVRANPNGREMGLARKIQLTPEGRGHPLYAGKPSVFDGYTSHEDEVTHVPPGAVILAGNAFTRVQAATITHEKGTFWGLQYHPEYDLHEMARLCWCRIDKLRKKGFFKDRAAGEAYVDLLETLHRDPERRDVAWLLGIDADIINPVVRQCEVKNWLERLVLPGVGVRR
jgi:GMP synthase (glutamine-hydrolysing)